MIDPEATKIALTADFPNISESLSWSYTPEKKPDSDSSYRRKRCQPSLPYSGLLG